MQPEMMRNFSPRQILPASQLITKVDAKGCWIPENCYACHLRNLCHGVYTKKCLNWQNKNTLVLT